MIRSFGPWFDKLNLYRNVVSHRGLENNKWGYYKKSDTAEETTDPQFNAMLLPDEQALRDRKHPHDWSYQDLIRLDDLIDFLDVEFSKLLQQLLEKVWNSKLPAEGRIPRAEQPNTLLGLPKPAVIQYADCRAVPVFETKTAARAFAEVPTEGLVLRAVRPTRIGSDPPCFLLPVMDYGDALPWRVHLYGMSEGTLIRRSAVDADPNAGVVRGILPLRPVKDVLSILYVWQSPKNGS